MSDDIRFERLLADLLAERAPIGEPELLVARILAVASRTGRRPRWLALMRERPMHLHARVAVGSPGMRAAYVVAVTLLLAVLAVGTVVSAASLLDPTPTIDPERGVFRATGSLGEARTGHTATLLPGGRVLVIGGWDAMDHLASAELWDPATASFSSSGSLLEKHSGHTTTLLSDGRILVIGGSGAEGELASAEVWDAVTTTFRPTGSLEDARMHHTATLLADGRVLVVGGWARVGEGDQTSLIDLASAEIWNPATGSFSRTSSLAEARMDHTATLLADGGVLIIGGSSARTGNALASAEVWDPDTGSFSSVGSLAEPRYGHTATLLPDGRVMVIGGSNDGPLRSAEIWDPGTGSFGLVGSLAEARTGQTATLLADGRVLVVGGGVPARNQFKCPGVCIASAEVWDTAKASFSRTGSLAEARMGHTATLLSDGRVLIVGGGLLDAVIGSAELYDPAARLP